MISKEYIKFMFKFNNKMLPVSFDNYFIKLENVNSYNTRQKYRYEYFQSFIQSDAGRKTLHHICLKMWTDMSSDFNYRHCSFSKFKKYFKTNSLTNFPIASFIILSFFLSSIYWHVVWCWSIRLVIGGPVFDYLVESDRGTWGVVFAAYLLDVQHWRVGVSTGRQVRLLGPWWAGYLTGLPLLLSGWTGSGSWQLDSRSWEGHFDVFWSSILIKQMSKYNKC